MTTDEYEVPAGVTVSMLVEEAANAARFSGFVAGVVASTVLFAAFWTAYLVWWAP